MAAEICCQSVESETSEAESALTPGEMAQFRQEKLDAIRAAIASGSYDSDELLGKAMALMLQRLQQSDGSSIP